MVTDPTHATAAPLTDAQKDAIRLSLDVFDHMLRPDRMASHHALVRAFSALWQEFPDLRPEDSQ